MPEQKRIRASDVIYLYLLVCLCAAALAGSRSFFIGYLISSALICLPDLREKISPIVRKVLIGSFIAIAAILTFFVKTDSTKGRILIYKLSWKMVSDHFWKGVGIGRYPFEYLEYQYRYFLEGHYSQKELLLADNTKHAFNDYLQLWVEHGLLGLLLILLFVLAYIFLLRIVLKTRPFPIITKIATLQSTSIAVAASFTHVFGHPIFQIAFVLSISQMILSVWPAKLKPYLRKGMQIILCLPFLFFNYSDMILKRKAYADLAYAGELQQMGYTTEALKTYMHIGNDFPFDIGYLSSYADALNSQGRFIQEQKVLIRLTRIDNASIFHNRLARSYERTGNYRLAEQEYLKSIYTVPNRLVPRRDLMKFYLSLEKKENALVVGWDILRLPIKIKSRTTESIVNDTRRIVGEIQNK